MAPPRVRRGQCPWNGFSAGLLGENEADLLNGNLHRSYRWSSDGQKWPRRAANGGGAAVNRVAVYPADDACDTCGDRKPSREATMSKFIIPIALALIFLASPASAGHCPRDVKKIDEALASAQLSATDLAIVIALRDKGEQAHGDGDHGGSLKALHEAMETLGIGH